MTRRRALSIWLACWGIVLGLLTLAGCNNDDHPGQHCVHSHEEYNPPVYIHSGNVMVPVGGGYESVCDSWAPNSSGSSS